MSENASKEVEQTERPQDENTTAVNAAHGDDAGKSTPSQREREQNAINAVNNSRHYASRVNMAQYEMQHVMEGMKNAPKAGIVFGLLSFFLLVADLIVATVLLINNIWVGAIVCAALFGGILITALIVAVVKRAIAMSGDISKAKKITDGKVKTCIMSSTTIVKSGRSESVRISGVVYRVVVSADDGDYVAYSKQFYETDEKVTIAVMGKKRAKIVDETELEKLNEPKSESQSHTVSTHRHHHRRRH